MNTDGDATSRVYNATSHTHSPRLIATEINDRPWAKTYHQG
jgi:hypothetical protein